MYPYDGMALKLSINLWDYTTGIYYSNPLIFFAKTWQGEIDVLSFFKLQSI